MPAVDIIELQKLIGQAPNTNNDVAMDDLFRRININLTTRQHVRQWLVAKGIPEKSVAAAVPISMAKAYNSYRYLQGWRARVNPSWDLLGGGDDDASADATSTSGSGSVPSAPSNPPAQAMQTPAQTEAWLKALFGQINASVEKLVTDRLNTTKLQLDDGAKNQIKQLAMLAAQQRVEELTPPRKIEVLNHATGQTTNVGLQHENFPLLLKAMSVRDHRGFRPNIWLTGPTGSGKTTAVQSAAEALSLEFEAESSLDADYKITGFYNAQGVYMPTAFFRRYTEGGIILLDEIDNFNPGALLAVNSATANGFAQFPHGHFKRHKDCIIVACANTWGLGATSEYVGRTRLDAASLDRFQPKIDWPYDEKLERAIALAQGGALGTEWFALVSSTRAKTKTQGLKIVISPRATYGGIGLLQQGFTPTEVVNMTMAAGLSPEQKKAIGLDVVRDMQTMAMPPSVASAAANAYASVPKLNGADALNSDIIREWNNGSKITAIKLYKDHYQCDLATAKHFVESIIAVHESEAAL